MMHDTPFKVYRLSFILKMVRWLVRNRTGMTVAHGCINDSYGAPARSFVLSRDNSP
jgi:hypothetical protein